MAGYAVLRGGRYRAGAAGDSGPGKPRSRTTWNPTFEWQYWRRRWGRAELAERLGLAREANGTTCAQRLSALPMKDGVYLAHENCPQTFTERNRDHPSMLDGLWASAGRGVDRDTMRRTLHKVMLNGSGRTHGDGTFRWWR